MNAFYQIIANSMFAIISTYFVWFALIFWIYLETKSVVATAFIGGSFMVMSSLSGFLFGSIVDHHRKKYVMLLSSCITLFFFSVALAIYTLTPKEAFTSITNPMLWLLVALILCGAVAANIRNIASQLS